MWKPDHTVDLRRDGGYDLAAQRISGCNILILIVNPVMLHRFLEILHDPRRYGWQVAHHEELPENPPLYEKIPVELHPTVADLILSSGIKDLYSHQVEAIRLCLAGRHVVLATSTASGKTLAYQAPVVDNLVRDPRSHGLFLFPVKALERDQRDALVGFAGSAGVSVEVYDGDTPETLRKKIRTKPPRVLITNPDMLHLGLLANHGTWRDFFANLGHVVLDEVHTYKGIFGSHISQVMLRLRRICDMYGSAPVFFSSSATIADPGKFVSRLIGHEVTVIDRCGAPSPTRHFIFINPELSPYTVAARLFIEALRSGLKTIVFTRARKITELITTWVMHQAPELRTRVSSYRAGFLPEERREIERLLFSGKMDGVISTSALEMGIDVGGLDLCLLVGYPGTIVNTWQRGGRVGRSGRQSAIVLIAGHDALDQYFLNHPKDFFGRSCEEAVLDPLNKEVLRRHLPCAASECPIGVDEPWTGTEQVQSVLKELEEDRVLFRDDRNGAWHSYQRKPQSEGALRGIGESFSIFHEEKKTLIGTSSGFRAFKECHEGAVYLHRTKQYLVTRMDLKRRNVIARPAQLSYYTRGLSEKETQILGAPIDAREFPGFTAREGRLRVTEQVVAYEKRRTSGQELIDVVDLDLPAISFETIGIWIEIPERVKQTVTAAGLHFMGGIHALEHAAISMFPLFALCDRDDIGGISTPWHEQVCLAAVFIYDGHPGGVGLAHHIFGRIEELLAKTRSLVQECPCEEGCPSCIHSPKCGSGNKPLDKRACLAVLEYLLEPEKLMKPRISIDDSKRRERPDRRAVPAHSPTDAVNVDRKPIFPDLAAGQSSSGTGQTSQPATDQYHRAEASHGREPKDTAAKLAFEARQGKTETAEQTSQRPAGPRQRAKKRVAPKALNHMRVVVFDVETQKLAQEVGGWGNIARMGLSVAVAHVEGEGFRTFTEDRVSELIELLKSADLVVGFNHVGFDYTVLSAYSRENLRALRNLDILQEVRRVLGFRLPMDHLAEVTLGVRKSGQGEDAVRWFREGRLDLIEKYCRDDVSITRDLFRFGLENGHLLYRKKNGRVGRIPVDWGLSGRTSSEE